MDHQRSRIVVPNSDDAGDAGDATAVDVVLVSDDLAGIVLDFVVVAIFTHQHTQTNSHTSLRFVACACFCPVAIALRVCLVGCARSVPKPDQIKEQLDETRNNE